MRRGPSARSMSDRLNDPQLGEAVAAGHRLRVGQRDHGLPHHLRLHRRLRGDGPAGTGKGQARRQGRGAHQSDSATAARPAVRLARR